MCPIDPSPHAGEVLAPTEKPFPAPNPTPDIAPHPTSGETSIVDRPPLPPTTEIMGVDVEDEEADPVVESGPGLEKKQTSIFTKD